MYHDTKAKVTNLIKEVMGINIGDYEASRKINTISEWDSFNNLMLISRMQEELNVEFGAVEIEGTQTIGDLWKLIEKKVHK
jgi:acyl carrier protein